MELLIKEVFMKKIIISITLASIAFSSASFAAWKEKDQMYSGKAQVYRVIDGDTFVVNDYSDKNYFALRAFAAKTDQGLKYFNDKYRSFRIRLATTDTAESKHVDKSRNTDAGKVASNYSEEQLTGKNIDYTCWKVGNYKRMICSISLNGKDYGIQLIENGYSSYHTKFGKHPYLHKEYQAADK